MEFKQVRFEHFWKMQENIYTNIRFADRKATVLITLVLAVSGAIITQDGYDFLLSSGSNNIEIYHFLLSYLNAVCGIVSTSFGIICIYPRSVEEETDLWENKKVLLSLGMVAKNNPDFLNEEIKKIEDFESLEYNLACLMWTRAKSNKIKYIWIRRQVFLSAISFLSAIPLIYVGQILQ